MRYALPPPLRRVVSAHEGRSAGATADEAGDRSSDTVPRDPPRVRWQVEDDGHRVEGSTAVSARDVLELGLRLLLRRRALMHGGRSRAQASPLRPPDVRRRAARLMDPRIASCDLVKPSRARHEEAALPDAVRGRARQGCGSAATAEVRAARGSACRRARRAQLRARVPPGVELGFPEVS